MKNYNLKRKFEKKSNFFKNNIQIFDKSEYNHFFSYNFFLYLSLYKSKIY